MEMVMIYWVPPRQCAINTTREKVNYVELIFDLSLIYTLNVGNFHHDTGKVELTPDIYMLVSSSKAVELRRCVCLVYKTVKASNLRLSKLLQVGHQLLRVGDRDGVVVGGPDS